MYTSMWPVCMGQCAHLLIHWYCTLLHHTIYNWGFSCYQALLFICGIFQLVTICHVQRLVVTMLNIDPKYAFVFPQKSAELIIWSLLFLNLIKIIVESTSKSQEISGISVLIRYTYLQLIAENPTRCSPSHILTKNLSKLLTRSNRSPHTAHEHTVSCLCTSMCGIIFINQFYRWNQKFLHVLLTDSWNNISVQVLNINILYGGMKGWIE